MECERFKKLLKSWYIQVQSEALAPARMVDFMENHVSDCPVCLMDPEAKRDIAKIITLVLPQDKLRQTVRPSQNDDPDDFSDEPEETAENSDEETEDEEGENEETPDTDDIEDDEDLGEDIDIEDEEECR